MPDVAHSEAGYFGSERHWQGGPPPESRGTPLLGGWGQRSQKPVENVMRLKKPLVEREKNTD